ncbi:MAG: hypothetical protein FD180_3037 [Planctomycetota bacterium]|nr:MAG: hypothetical protein FD180_3037 [Planctomycetota bacterium]
MSRFKAGDSVQFNRIFMHKGIFVTQRNPTKVKAVREAAGAEAEYDVVFLDAEGNPHVVEKVKEADLLQA